VGGGLGGAGKAYIVVASEVAEGWQVRKTKKTKKRVAAWRSSLRSGWLAQGEWVGAQPPPRSLTWWP